jgi:hypothetical protein
MGKDGFTFFLSDTSPELHRSAFPCPLKMPFLKSFKRLLTNASKVRYPGIVSTVATTNRATKERVLNA